MASRNETDAVANAAASEVAPKAERANQAPDRSEATERRQSAELAPEASQAPENAPQAVTAAAVDAHGASEAHANPAERKTARDRIADRLWWSIPSTDDADAKAKAAVWLDEYAAEVRAEFADLQAAALHARAALAALCYDLEDPGSNALGALYLLQQATLYASASKDDTSDALLRHACKVLHGVADIADPEPPEVSFFGPTFGPQVADWLRMLADQKAVTA